VCGEIELAGDYGNIVIGNGPLVIVFTFVEVHEVAGHPEVAATIGIVALIEFFHPLGVGLAAEPDAFDGLVALRGES